MIKRKDYNKLIEKIIVYAKANPAGYKRRVILLGILGYAYIFVVLAVFSLLLLATILLVVFSHGAYALVKVIFFLGIVIWVILRSLWVKIPPPTGMPVDEKSAPRLFSLIDEICARQECPKPHHVFINSDFNAFIVQNPRWGIFGGYKNYLVLGLPYMMSCDLDHFKAVLAHEFGHFSGAHGKTGTWVHRIRSTWIVLMANFEREKIGSFIFRWFFNWYVPYFNAYSFVMSREHEFEADRYATDFAGVRANAEELVNSVIKGDNNKYWQTLIERNKYEPQPPPDAITRSVDDFKKPVPEMQYAASLKRALNLRTQGNDTHPALRERLAALGYRPENDCIVNEKGEALTAQMPIEKSAAEDLLGMGLVSETLKKFDEQWFEYAQAGWKKRYDNFQKASQELESLENKEKQSALDQEEQRRKAMMIDELRSRTEAIEAIEKLLSFQPQFAPGHFRLGVLCLQGHDPRGVDHLKKAMELDKSLSTDCMEWIRWHYETTGDHQKADGLLDPLDENLKKDRQDALERGTVSSGDKLKSHDLPVEILEDLKIQLKPFEKQIKAVYFVQKEMKVYQDVPMYVLIVESKPPFPQSLSPEKFNRKLLDELLAKIILKITKGNCYFVINDTRLKSRAAKIPGSLIFRPRK